MNESESSPFPEYMDAQQGHRKRVHRGRRSRGKGPKPASTDHMADANASIDAARKDTTPKGTTAHLFRALSSLKKC